MVLGALHIQKIIFVIFIYWNNDIYDRDNVVDLESTDIGQSECGDAVENKYVFLIKIDILWHKNVGLLHDELFRILC